MSSFTESSRTASKPRFAPLLLAVLLVLIVAVMAWQVMVIPESMIQMTVGPVLVPGVVVGVLGLLAVLYGVSVWRGRQVDESLAEGQRPLPGRNARMFSLLAGGVLFVALVQFLGFVIPAALCGMGVARAFDAKLGWRSALICLGIAAFFWFVLAYLLGVGLGPAVSWPFAGPAALSSAPA